MKVKIFTEGGKDIGMGHISRCSSLYDEISSRGIAVDFIVFGDVSDVSFLAGIQIKNENWLDKEYLIRNISKEDYVIIDSYKADKELYDIIDLNSKKALYIDDIGRLDYPGGFILNPSLDSSHINYSETAISHLLTGPKFVILRRPFIGSKRKFVRKRIERVLITMGGSDIRGLTPLIISKVCSERLDLFFDVIISSEESQFKKGYDVNNININIHTNVNADEMMKLMIKADIAITAAGQTIYELLATQTPFIPIQIISKFDYRKEQSLIYKDIIDGYGSKRIIDKLLMDM